MSGVSLITKQSASRGFYRTVAIYGTHTNGDDVVVWCLCVTTGTGGLVGPIVHVADILKSEKSARNRVAPSFQRGLEEGA